jgi:5-methylcytosine-specific restriction endonuclease McrA
MARRPAISLSVQAAVFFRDRWLCHLCGRPVVFGPALKRIARHVESRLPGVRPAYYDPQWRRDLAPLLDELGASVDHVQAFSKGGSHDLANFATACARCNARKSARNKDDFLAFTSPWKVKGKHGEPTRWDGLTGLFLVLARSADDLTTTERSWVKALSPFHSAAHKASTT